MQKGMNLSAVVGLFVLPAVAFALAYFPIVTTLSRGLASPYSKADVRKRLSAATIDGVIVVSMGVLYWTTGSALSVAGGAAYLLFRDAISGQSIGKFVCGLVVISLETGRPSSLAASVRRNLLFLLPGANVVAIFLETRTIWRDRQGQRLGDKLAQTQVVEGFGAKDLVKSFQDALMGVGSELGRGAGRRRRAPVRADRAA
jgi:uncharacterized RDD family membrane protein YckC